MSTASVFVVGAAGVAKVGVRAEGGETSDEGRVRVETGFGVKKKEALAAYFSAVAISGDLQGGRRNREGEGRNWVLESEGGEGKVTARVLKEGGV